MQNNKTITRRHLLTQVLPATAAAPAIVSMASLSGLAGSPAAASTTKINEDGLHVQPWFADTFLDLREDLADANAAGKKLAIFWEQRGCPYCREMHEVNLAQKDISDYIQKNFMVVQLNLYGAREVTDFDGEKLPEKKLARKWRVNFTPTIIFPAATVAETKGKSARDSEAWRLVGYWKPFHFRSTFVYVSEEGYKSQPNFQRWLSKYADKLRAQGKKVKLW